ncbi:conserved hypothetical protein [Culex quinquefasciatus]|uniref:Leucine-rich immune protein (Short) n=1 Tax=Culex quinquefasciatus TaxID=7176 RepID=B0X1K8_CULQU|nr:conserved hypothetical protein [Culex quinquefasciatus]|eukprot:XP_001863530.1 conserved hypothetical protein [Culex quinquefasciatus]
MNFAPNFVWLILVFHINVCRAWTSWTPSTNSKILFIKFENETVSGFPQFLNYHKYAEIELQEPYINELTVEMQSVFVNAIDLGIHDGSILYLHDNQIEFVEMSEFNGLDKLKMLALQNNKIAEIRATLQNPAVLPKLEKFYINNNRLTDISFEHWNTTSLYTIHLHENQLQIALSLPGKLTGLKGVALDTNPLNCEWLNSTLKELKNRNVKVYDGHITKCNATGPELKEIVRRVNFKETFATLPLLQHSQSELKEALKNKLTNLSDLSANTTLKVESLQAEVRNKMNSITNEALKGEQQLGSIKSEILRITGTHQSHEDEIQQIKRMLDELRHQLNASAVSPDADLAYGGIFKLERYSAILVVLGIFLFFYLIAEVVKCRR